MFSAPSAMDPMLPRATSELRDLSLDVYKASSRLAGRLHPVTARTLAAVLRNVNSYYSNLIEGHRTSLLDIERGLAEDYAQDAATRDLQVLHRLHVQAQDAVDRLLDEQPETNVCAPDFVRMVHRLFFAGAPDEFLLQSTQDGSRSAVTVPGELRTQNVRIMRHVPPDAAVLPRFMDRLAESYDPTRLHGDESLLAVAASHHRLLWVHPFLEGNGRVARMVTHAFFRRVGLDGYGLWTMSRGLARQEAAYKQALAQADSPRRGDYDGRGALSERALAAFCRFFLETALDQATFMERTLALDAVRGNIERYCAARGRGEVPGRPKLPPEAAAILTQAFEQGELAKSAVPGIIHASERKARDVVRALLDDGLLRTAHHKAPLTLALPSHVLEDYFPKLCPA
ncbi:filamentation induced by cAMP protein Fic [Desulfovibrio sp. X2]|uniref:Fic family protein n=1 Tax=Desulfovibrio sp. X2 TaxID=941449 RepID=UPI000358DFD5|nr:Fic family protein [Desulfovibrio sp. X2]EPR43450.1 filamentation induced by cAMP protein Fic [Desulfovibrio sp. X2]